MKLNELKSILKQYPELNLRFGLPSGDLIPAHAHVTEIARIDKRFIDCGGTQRTETLCRLQIWVADDFEHRLKTAKLLRILEKAAPVLETGDLDVDVEHEVGVITQLPLASADLANGELVLRLTERHTACLAEDKCKCQPTIPAPIRFDFAAINFKPVAAKP